MTGTRPPEPLQRNMSIGDVLLFAFCIFVESCLWLCCTLIQCCILDLSIAVKYTLRCYIFFIACLLVKTLCVPLQVCENVYVVICNTSLAFIFSQTEQLKWELSSCAWCKTWERKGFLTTGNFCHRKINDCCEVLGGLFLAGLTDQLWTWECAIYDSYSRTNAASIPVTAQRPDKMPSKAVHLMLFVPVQLHTLCPNDEK